MKDIKKVLSVLENMFGEQEAPKEKPPTAEQTIALLKKTDFKDKEAFFKMTQLLKGLAVAASGGDKVAIKFLSQLSDDLVKTADAVLGA